MTHIPGKFVWRELHTTDVPRAKAFYTELFGWASKPMDMGDFTYEAFGLGDRTFGGFVSGKGLGGWHGYLSVADVDASAAAAAKAGGKVLREPMDMPNVGRAALVEDGGGAKVFLFKSAHGDAEDADGAVGLIHWDELWSRDAAAATKFYAAVAPFELDQMAMPSGTYHLLKTGDTSRAGIVNAAQGADPGWLFFVEVADCDATLGRAQSLGAKTFLPPTDIPNIGRFAVVLDPDGARVGFIKPA